jgi:hypothetical protein
MLSPFTVTGNIINAQMINTDTPVSFEGSPISFNQGLKKYITTTSVNSDPSNKCNDGFKQINYTIQKPMFNYLLSSSGGPMIATMTTNTPSGYTASECISNKCPDGILMNIGKLNGSIDRYLCLSTPNTDNNEPVCNNSTYLKDLDVCVVAPNMYNPKFT